MDTKFYSYRVMGWGLVSFVVLNILLLLAQAVGVGYGEQLSFESLRDGDWDIYVVDLRTGLSFNLTDNAFEDHAASWSGNGRHVAYTSTLGASDALFVADWTGANLVRWTPDNFTGNGLTSNWSPDSSQLVLQLNDPYRNWKVFLAQPGYRLRQLVDLIPYGSGMTIAWSPDESQFAYYYRNFADTYSNWQLLLMDFDGASQPLVADTHWDQRPAWSPDGTSIVYVSALDGELYSIDVTTQEQQRLTDASGHEMTPAWSPDGHAIAFVSQRDGDQEIYLLDMRTRELRRLTWNAGSDVFPTWSPDSRRLAFVSQRDGNREIYVVDTQSGVTTRITAHSATDTSPLWLP